MGENSDNDGFDLAKVFSGPAAIMSGLLAMADGGRKTMAGVGETIVTLQRAASQIEGLVKRTELLVTDLEGTTSTISKLGALLGEQFSDLVSSVVTSSGESANPPTSTTDRPKTKQKATAQTKRTSAERPQSKAQNTKTTKGPAPKSPKKGNSK